MSHRRSVRTRDSVLCRKSRSASAATPALWASEDTFHGGGRGCHVVQQRIVGAQAVPQPYTGHAVALGKGLQNQQRRVRCQKGPGADAVLREIEEALVQKQPRPLCRADLQDLFQQRQRQQPSGGVVGGCRGIPPPVFSPLRRTEIYRPNQNSAPDAGNTALRGNLPASVPPHIPQRWGASSTAVRGRRAVQYA